jgi:hypothetical protein
MWGWEAKRHEESGREKVVGVMDGGLGRVKNCRRWWAKSGIFEMEAIGMMY